MRVPSLLTFALGLMWLLVSCWLRLFCVCVFACVVCGVVWRGYACVCLSRNVVMKSLEYLAKEDPQGYFAEPVDPDLVPGYKDVVSRQQ